MKSFAGHFFLMIAVALTSCCLNQAVAQNAVPVTLKKNEDGSWALTRGGELYEIKGAGGEGPLDMLKNYGGNSTRTWGADETTKARLDEAHANGISVMVGIWIGHERHGFDYTDFDSVAAQIDQTVAAVKMYKDHPAVLAWGIGNEMEGAIGDNPVIWTHIEYLARLVKEEDPNHPTVTTIAEIGAQGEKVKAINRFCPNIDIIGINSYGGAPTLAERFKGTNSAKPYIVTEFGPLGPWEVGANNIDSIDERTSTEKAEAYRSSYKKFQADPVCIGSYSFIWGHKQEATATWFGMMLADGRRTEVLDAMSEAWTGKPVSNRCPKIASLKLEGKNVVKAGESLRFSLEASDPENDEISVDWVLMADAKTYSTGGDFQKTPPSMPQNIVESNNTSVTVTAPEAGGLYRVYAYVGDESKGAACANVVFRVQQESDGATEQETVAGVETTIPFVVYDEVGEREGAFFVPSGHMGDTEGIEMDESCTDNPKVGEMCIKNTFNRKDGWAGVVWQYPENDWGELPDGIDLSGATRLTFWARGEEGGEKMTLGFGVLGSDKAHPDTAKKESEITLTKEWKQYGFDVSEADLTRIKSGFFWSLASPGKPLTFYLDDIKFE